MILLPEVMVQTPSASEGVIEIAAAPLATKYSVARIRLGDLASMKHVTAMKRSKVKNDPFS